MPRKQWPSTANESGYVTTMASIEGRSIAEVEARLGFSAGYLSEGYAIYELVGPVGAKEFAWRDRTWYSAGVTAEPSVTIERDGKKGPAAVPRFDDVRGALGREHNYDEKKVDEKLAEILKAAQRRLNVRMGPERIVKVMAAGTGAATYPDSEYRNIPQWELLRPKRFPFKLAAIIFDDGMNQLLSGTLWWHANQHKYSNSAAISDLAPQFRPKVEKFVKALQLAGAVVRPAATLRNHIRAHLMHYCFKLSKGQVRAGAIPAIDGCDIVWDHGVEAHSRAAAKEMVKLFDIVYEPSLKSLHIKGLAIDMSISWSGTIKVKDAQGKVFELGAPQSGAKNTVLHRIGATYGVKKLLSDAPHWSSNGH